MTTRKDNVLYDCGHTGHVVLSSRYDGRDGPIPVQELFDDTGPWNCMDCHRKEILGVLRKDKSPQA